MEARASLRAKKLMIEQDGEGRNLMYRSRDWKNKYREMLKTGGWHISAEEALTSHGFAFEEGADAMLEALRKSAWKVPNELDWVSFSKSLKGRLLFIPDEGEPNGS